MADSLVDLGIQDALRYVHVNIIPSVVLLVRDISMITVTSLTCVSSDTSRTHLSRGATTQEPAPPFLRRCSPTSALILPFSEGTQIFFAYALARSVTFAGAAWVLSKCGAALLCFHLVWRHVVDPFIYAKTREYVELGKRRRLPNMTGGSLFSPPPREDPLAERRRGGGVGGGSESVGGGTLGGSGRGGTSFRKSSDDSGSLHVDDLPTVSSGLRAASVPTGRRGLSLKSLRDGATVCVELRGAGSGGGEGWSEGFLCVHPHKTYETAAALGALNWGGHQITVASRGTVETICRGESVSSRNGNADTEGGVLGDGTGDRGGGSSRGGKTFATPEAHEREVNRFLFRLHLFGTGRDITLRSESTGTLVTTFLLGVRFDRRRVVAWHRQRSSKVLTAGVSMFTPPEGGAWEEFALSPVKRSPMGLVPVDVEDESAAEFVMCRPREGTYWSYNAAGDEMFAFTRDLQEASLFRLHRA